MTEPNELGLTTLEFLALFLALLINRAEDKTVRVSVSELSAYLERAADDLQLLKETNGDFIVKLVAPLEPETFTS